ncbi:uncharacterized protein LOC142821194 isoform X2 [Pelodiscus sinensis]|uniref:uncharacterized protein LOC142821194 isoform X2 n=1 Tax=Pelodiscus sinensis TaxID=13735 RepID=UPI003F6B6D99
MAPALLRLLVTASVVTYSIAAPWRARNPHGATRRSRDAPFPASAPGPRPLPPPMAHLSGALHDGHQEIGIFPWNHFTIPKPAPHKSDPWSIILQVFFLGSILFGLSCCCCCCCCCGCCDSSRDVEISAPTLLQLELRSQDQSHAPQGQAAEVTRTGPPSPISFLLPARSLCLSPAPGSRRGLHNHRHALRRRPASAISREQTPASRRRRGGVSQDAVLPPPAKGVGKT